MHCQWFTISSCITWCYRVVTLKACFHRTFSYCVCIYIYTHAEVHDVKHVSNVSWPPTHLHVLNRCQSDLSLSYCRGKSIFQLYRPVLKSVGYLLSLAAWICICFMDRSRTVYKMCPLMLYRRNKVIQLGMTQGWINESILQKVCGL